MIRVLVVEGSALMRQVLGDLLGTHPDFDVVGSARGGDEAIRLTRDLRPDVVVLDVEMSAKSGVDVLAGIMTEAPTPVVMLTTTSAFSAQSAFEALDKGAVDVVLKPRSGSLEALKAVRDELAAKIHGATTVSLGRRPRRGIHAALPPRLSDRVLLVAAGIGGPRALTCLFETLPAGLDVPILIAQQMPPGLTEMLARRLGKTGSIRIREAHEGDRVTAGLALLAPGGRNMVVTPTGDIDLFDGPGDLVRPSADRFLESAADAYGPRCLALILTGAGEDGSAGALAIRRRGGVVLAESETTCFCAQMPRAAAAAGAVDAEYPIQELGHAAVAILARRIARSA